MYRAIFGTSGEVMECRDFHTLYKNALLNMTSHYIEVLRRPESVVFMHNDEILPYTLVRTIRYKSGFDVKLIYGAVRVTLRRICWTTGDEGR